METFSYQVGEDTFDVPKDQVKNFLLRYPDAQQVKGNGVAGTGASASPGANQASNLESISVDGSSESQKNSFEPQFSKGGNIINKTVDAKFNSSWDVSLKKATDGILIPSIKRKDSNHENYTYGDQRSLDEKVNDYQKDYRDAYNGEGRFEFLKDKPIEERLTLIQNLVSKPDYLESVYNAQTDSFDRVPTEESVKLMSSYLPSDFELYSDPKEFTSAMQQGVGQAINNDPVMLTQLNAVTASKRSELESLSLELNKKYDTSTPDGLAKAEKETD